MLNSHEFTRAAFFPRNNHVLVLQLKFDYHFIRERQTFLGRINRPIKN